MYLSISIFFLKTKIKTAPYLILRAIFFYFKKETNSAFKEASKSVYIKGLPVLKFYTTYKKVNITNFGQAYRSTTSESSSLGILCLCNHFSLSRTIYPGRLDIVLLLG